MVASARGLGCIVLSHLRRKLSVEDRAPMLLLTGEKAATKTTARTRATAFVAGGHLRSHPSQSARWMGHPGGLGPGEENRQRHERGVGWETAVVEKRISPLRRSR